MCARRTFDAVPFPSICVHYYNIIPTLFPSQRGGLLYVRSKEMRKRRRKSQQNNVEEIFHTRDSHLTKDLASTATCVVLCSIFNVVIYVCWLRRSLKLAFRVNLIHFTGQLKTQKFFAFMLFSPLFRDSFVVARFSVD